MAGKTNAMRRLDELGVPYQTRDYDVDPDDLTAATVAAKIRLPVEQVFKTLVVRGEVRGVVFAVVSGDSELNLKALAKLAGDRKMEMTPLKDVRPLTGYIRGGVTAIAAKKDYPVFIDETAILYDLISISAGMRGTQILLQPEDYSRIVSGTFGDIAKTKC